MTDAKSSAVSPTSSPERAARELLSRHGEHAIGIVSARLIVRSRTDAQRAHDRRIVGELKRLDHIRRFGPTSPAYSVTAPRLAALIGAGRLAASLLYRRIVRPVGAALRRLERLQRSRRHRDAVQHDGSSCPHPADRAPDRHG